MLKMQKIGSHGLSTPRNIASSKSPKSYFKPSRRQIVYLEPFANLKHYLRDFVLVAFFDAQDSQKELACPFDTLKHLFDFSKVVI
jgi:hypothetical protein